MHAKILALTAAAIGLGGTIDGHENVSPGPAVSFVGPHSRVLERRFERVSTPEAWDDLWHEHTGQGRKFKDPKYAFSPRIDFSRFEAVAFFRGPSINQDGEAVVSIDADASRVRIRFEAMSFQTAAMPGQTDHGVACEPFGIWIIDRTDKPIVVEENVQDLIGRPPLWKEQHRFEARPR